MPSPVPSAFFECLFIAQVLEMRLKYAIHNCLAIDADDTSVGRNAAGMGWGDGL